MHTLLAKKRRNLQSFHSGSVDLSSSSERKSVARHAQGALARAALEGAPTDSNSVCSLEEVDILSHMLDTVFSVEENEHVGSTQGLFCSLVRTASVV